MTFRLPRTSLLPALTVLTALLASACAPTVRGAAPMPESRVFDSRANRFIDFATLVERAATADVVFFGEQHDDPATHRAELALLAAIGAKHPDVVLSLEMFERDVQPVLDRYLAGQVPESTFVATSRPWPNYAADYRALVELARANGWPVVASNVPRRIASAVSRAGLPVLDTMGAADRALAARQLDCPRDRYFELFAEQMSGHSAGAPGTGDTAAARTMTERYYQAQCVKDETMAEAIDAALNRAGRGAVLVHYNGAFHSDFSLGTAARVKSRRPSARILVITAVPVPDPATAEPGTHKDRADYVILAPRPPARR